MFNRLTASTVQGYKNEDVHDRLKCTKDMRNTWRDIKIAKRHLRHSEHRPIRQLHKSAQALHVNLYLEVWISGHNNSNTFKGLTLCWCWRSLGFNGSWVWWVKDVHWHLKSQPKMCLTAYWQLLCICANWSFCPLTISSFFLSHNKSGPQFFIS